LLFVAAFAALLFVDPALFRGHLEAGASAAFGRGVHFGGPIRLERSLTPRIVVNQMTIDNPPWASADHLAAADEVAVQVALLPLLFGELRVLDVGLTGVQVFLEEGPDGADNFTFGAPGAGQQPGPLPAVERLLVQDAVITHRSASARLNRCEIDTARLWNMPGQPERIEAEGRVKGVPFRITLAADTPAEASDPQNPWSVKLEVAAPDLTLTAAGRVAQAFAWKDFQFAIALSGDRPDSLAQLFEVEFPAMGPFELSATVTGADGRYRMTELRAHLQELSGAAEITIESGTASGGRKAPLEAALQGRFGDAPLALTFFSERFPDPISRTDPWPLTGNLQLADAELDFRGTLAPAAEGSRLALEGRLQGEELDTLTRHFGGAPTQVGPYRLAFHALIAAGAVSLTDLEGEIGGRAPLQTIRIVAGNASVRQGGAVAGEIAAERHGVPLSLSFQGGPHQVGAADTTDWPLQLAASVAGVALAADGAVVTTPQGRSSLNLAARLTGDRLDALGRLLGASLPRLAPFDLRARVTSGDGVHELRDLALRLGADRLTGALRWDGSAPRGLLTGRLSSGRLSLKALADAAAAPPARARPTDLANTPVRVDWLEFLDARLELAVNTVADSPVAVENLNVTLTVAGGTLDATFRGRLAGNDLEGQLALTAPGAMPSVRLQAATGRIDAGQALRQLNLPAVLAGRVDAVRFEGRSAGRTLGALREAAEISVKISPASVTYSGQLMSAPLTLLVTNVAVSVSAGRPVSATLAGTLNQAPFDATLGAGTLADLFRKDGPLPVRATLQVADMRLHAEGVVTRPFRRRAFDLAHDLAGKEIQTLDALLGAELPLRGAFQATGRISGRGSRYTHEGQLRVGKTDLQADVTVLEAPARPKISGRIQAGTLHLSDLALPDGGAGKGPAADPSRVIPDTPLPTDLIGTVDLDLALGAGRIITETGVQAGLASTLRLQNGRLHFSPVLTGAAGDRAEGELEIDAAARPPAVTLRLDAQNLDFGLLRPSPQYADLVEGRIDLHAELSGAGATLRSLLGNAAGSVTLIAGEGRISGRGLDLWAADLIPTMLSPRWQRENVTEMNCAVAHIELKQGLAELADFILDTRRITVAGSGKLNLKTEALDLVLAPRPKRSSLVSLANPVAITGTLATPRVSVARLPSRRRLLRTGLLAGLVNPVFLLTAFSDLGTGGANSCAAAIERATRAAGADRVECGD
ncbi:MAG: AsmA family protein, partial [Desulfobacterales bacterium]|nr:AsmA family protein [Desulfobacterales bacterium]